MIALRLATVVLAAAILGPGTLSISRAAQPAKPAEKARSWAARVERPGLPNLHQVGPGLYRSAQPTAEGMKELEKMGIKTVVNLRALHSDKDEIGKAKLVSERIPMNTWKPTEDQVVRFLRVVTDKNRGPILVHCQHGADRTGMMCAIYRVAVCGWTKQEAIQEMTKGDFGFHPMWTNLPKFIEGLDVEAVKKKAEIDKPSPN
jgi:protein tyrosine phosphatase (PTP) superfamily phosphohydrolase (DUF442 family)